MSRMSLEKLLHDNEHCYKVFQPQSATIGSIDPKSDLEDTSIEWEAQTGLMGISLLMGTTRATVRLRCIKNRVIICLIKSLPT